MPAVQSGALAPLRSSYLKRLVKSGEALQKRQDLPEAAFWDVAAFKRLTQSRNFWASIFALSYRWLTAEHPDPDRFHLSKVVALLEMHKAFFVKAGFNVDDCAVFWDFGSLFQPERTHDQKALFREGLRASNVWYGSALHDGPDPVAPSSRVHRHAVHSKRVVFRGSDDQFRHQDERYAVRHGSLGAGRCREPGHGRGL